MNLIKLLIYLSLLVTNQAFADDAQTLGRGGTIMFDTNQSQSSLFSPSGLDQNNLSFDLSLSATASEGLIKLSRESKTVQPGTYDQRISTYYGQDLSADANGSFLINYKGFMFIPQIYLVNGSATLNNPSYPNGNADLSISKGQGVGYASHFENLHFGVSAFRFETTESQYSGNVLDYQAGLVQNSVTREDTLQNYNLRYDLSGYDIAANYQHSTLSYVPRDRYFLGVKKNMTSYLKGYLEFHDLESNVFDNSVHAGLSLTPIEHIELNVGLNQLYPTYGAGIVFSFIKIYFSKSGASQFEEYRQRFDEYTGTLVFHIEF